MKVGSLNTQIKTSVFDAKVPLLLRDDLIKIWRISLINEESEAYTKIGLTNDRFQKKEKGHWFIPLSGETKDAKETHYPINIENTDENESEVESISCSGERSSSSGTANASKETNNEEESYKEQNTLRKEDLRKIHIKNAHNIVPGCETL